LHGQGLKFDNLKFGKLFKKVFIINGIQKNEALHHLANILHNLSTKEHGKGGEEPG
jgi:hypothetical protein